MEGKLYVEKRKSTKTGNDYLVLVFENLKGETFVVSYDSRMIATFLMANQ